MNKIKLIEIGIAWNYRPQTLKECAEEFLVFLERLKRFDNRFNLYYMGGNTKEEAIQNKGPYTYETIKHQMCKNCKDSDYPEYTFQAGFWNGASKDSLSMGINVSSGGVSKIGHNCCILRFPYEGEIYEHYLKKNNFQALQDLFIDHWDPEKIMDENGKWMEVV